MIHDDHPFATPDEERDPVRQFRGRLVAPVTVLTTGSGDRIAGLTVSSLMVAEGDPAVVHALVGTTTDFWDVLQEWRRFVVQILPDAARDDAHAFAGLRPRPGGPFADVAIEPTQWGPALQEAPNRLYCALVDTAPLPFHMLIQGAIEQADIEDFDEPAVYFRGRYRRLAAGP